MRRIPFVSLCLAWLNLALTMPSPLSSGFDHRLLQEREEGQVLKALSTFLLSYNPTPLGRIPTQKLSVQRRDGRVAIMEDEKPKPKSKLLMPGDDKDDTEPAKEEEKKETARFSADQTYNMMLTTMLKLNETELDREVRQNFALFDKTCLDRLARDKNSVNVNETTKQRYEAIITSVGQEAERQLGEAAEALQELFASPNAVVMEAKMRSMAIRGRITVSLQELLLANLEQAKAAGEAGKQAQNVITILLQKIKVELDKKVPPTTKLFRQLTREDNSAARRDLLRKRFQPKQGVAAGIVLEGSMSKEEETKLRDTSPDIDPREFAEFLQEIKARFGNLDEGYNTGFVTRLQEICVEAEEVAYELAGGNEVTAKEAQDMAWEDESISVWDLAQFEEEAHQDGKMAVWEKDAQAQIKKDEESRKKGVLEDFDQ